MNTWKVTVLTPKNQAEKCIKSQKDQIVGIAGWSKVVKEKVVDHNKFYYIVQLKNKYDINKLITRAARAEVLIKKFYSILFKTINRANKLAKKFNRGVFWVKKWLITRLKKTTQGNDGMVDYIKKMDDKEFVDFLTIDDKEEMQKLLSNQLIYIKEIKEKK